MNTRTNLSGFCFHKLCDLNCKQNAKNYTSRLNASRVIQLLHGELDNPFAAGSFRSVARARYKAGPRKGALCVAKWYHGGLSSSRVFFDLDIKSVKKTLSFVKQWNSEHIIDQLIRVNIPEIFHLSSSFGSLAGAKVLVEPYISSWTKCKSCNIFLIDPTF